jgi:hypothetical protein
MTTNRQLAANRANARRSTGPKTAAGKVRSAGNSRRHGLTAPPDADALRAWYRLILADPSASLDPLERDPRQRAAHDLADAEARLQRVRLAEEQYFRNPEGDFSRAELDMIETRDILLDGAEHFGWDKEGRRLLGRVSKMLQRWTVRRQKSQKHRGRLLARYRGVAEARRRTALRRWITEITKRTQLQS